MSLDSLRAEIDGLDREIVKLVGRRASLAQEIGLLKTSGDAQVYDPAREHDVYDRVAGLEKGPLPAKAVKAIYREIMSASLALERPTRVAYFGPPGTFTHQAARGKFGASVEYIPESSVPDVFSAVSADRADYGVVPVENSTEGPINIAWDMLADTPLKVIAETYLPIRLCLLGRGPMSSIRRVYSHAQPLAQARGFLATHLPAVEIREASSTIAGVEAAAVERGAAAIASELAAEGRDIEVLARDVEDSADNETRFFVIGGVIPKPTGSDKTALLFTTAHQAGALVEVLNVFERCGVNLTNIDTRPSRRKNWEYYFFVDCEGHIEDRPVARAVAEARQHCLELHVLGSFPKVDQTI